MPFRISTTKKRALLFVAGALIAVLLYFAFTGHGNESAVIAGAVLTAWTQRTRAERRRSELQREAAEEAAEELAEQTANDSARAGEDAREDAQKWLDRPF